MLELDLKMRKLYRYWPIALLVLISCAYYWKLFRGDVPFPGDLLIGAYLPWLEYKWGNVIGVAIKNVLISDIFSQFFLWKNEISRNFLQGQWPLWNPYSYSGYPLLANFNSGALNPLNLLLIVFGSINGWSLFVFAQTIGSALAMYTYLKICKRETLPSVISSVVYAFGGFSILWSQFVNVGTAMIWIPLILAVIEYTGLKKENYRLYLVSPLLVLIVFSGHLQALVYACAITVGYYVYRLGVKNWSRNLALIISILLALGMSAIQLLPTIELMNLSIRFADSFTTGINYGLLPAKNIITMVAPDFFGNPSTGNFWGFFDYHETMTYVSILGMIGLIYGLINFKKLQQGKFFLWLAVLALLLQFDTPIGKAVYDFKFPLISTSVAGRIQMVFLLSVSVLVSEMLSGIIELRLVRKMELFFPIFSMMILSGTIAFVCIYLFKTSPGANNFIKEITNLTIGLRNLVVPTGITVALLAAFIFSNKFKHWQWLVLLVLIMDLFRFGWKYTPFVPKKYIYPETETLSFIKEDKSVFRIEKELGEILPQNTWTAYQLMSPSGYDPMAIKSYAESFSRDINKVEHPEVTRFSEINTYDAEALGKYNVKYLLAIKRDKTAKLGGDSINYGINQEDWKKVFETKMVAILLNSKYQERARITDDHGNNATGSASIVSYENNKVIIDFVNRNGTRLLLADSFYPGWKAILNGQSVKIENNIEPFRSIKLEKGDKGKIIFEYRPDSFRLGMIVSAISLGLWGALSLYLWRQRRK